MAEGNIVFANSIPTGGVRFRRPTDYIYTGGGGSLVLIMGAEDANVDSANANTVTFSNLSSGVFAPLEAREIVSTTCIGAQACWTKRVTFPIEET